MAYAGLFESDNATEVTTLTTESLNATSAEVGDWIKLYAKAVRGDAPAEVELAAGAVVSLTGTTAAKWQLAPDDGGAAGTPVAYGADLTFAAVIPESGTPFWIRAKATADEDPQNDTSVDVSIAGTAVAA